MNKTIEFRVETTSDEPNTAKAEQLVQDIEGFLEDPKVKDIRAAIEVLKKAEEKYAHEKGVLATIRSREDELESQLTERLNNLLKD